MPIPKKEPVPKEAKPAKEIPIESTPKAPILDLGLVSPKAPLSERQGYLDSIFEQYKRLLPSSLSEAVKSSFVCFISSN